MSGDRVHIDIDVRVDGDEIRGHATDGTERMAFSGWLGLIGVLDALLASPPAQMNQTTE